MGVGQDFRGNDALAYRVGYMGSDEGCPHDIQYACNKDGLANRDGFGSHCGRHGIGDIIGPDIPGHVKSKGKSRNKNNIFCRHNRLPPPERRHCFLQRDCVIQSERVSDNRYKIVQFWFQLSLDLSFRKRLSNLNL